MMLIILAVAIILDPQHNEKSNCQTQPRSSLFSIFHMVISLINTMKNLIVSRPNQALSAILNSSPGGGGGCSGNRCGGGGGGGGGRGWKKFFCQKIF